MKRLLFFWPTLLLCLAPAYAASGTEGPKPRAQGVKSATKASQALPQSPAEENWPDDPVARAKFEKLGPLLSEIGEEAAFIAGGKSDGLFLYAEMDGNQATVFVFRDRGKTVKWFVETERLRVLVEQAWALEPPGKRWVAMAYEGKGLTFDARMLYPEEVDFKQPFEKRLIARMPERFGGKKVIIERKPSRDVGQQVYEPAGENLDPELTGRRS